MQLMFCFSKNKLYNNNLESIYGPILTETNMTMRVLGATGRGWWWQSPLPPCSILFLNFFFFYRRIMAHSLPPSCPLFPSVDLHANLTMSMDANPMLLLSAFFNSHIHYGRRLSVKVFLQLFSIFG